MKELEREEKEPEQESNITLKSKLDLKITESASKNLRSEKQLLSLLDEENKNLLYALESELYADIATLQSLSKNFEEGRIDPSTFKRQLKALMKNAFKSKYDLENMGLDVESFIASQGFLEEFNLAVKKLKLEPGGSSAIYDILLESPAKIAAKTYDIVTNFDTLSDLVKLRYNATYELTSTLLNDLLISVRNYPGFGSDHWICREIISWQNQLAEGKSDDLLDEKIIEKLDNRVSIWKNEFYQKIKELSF